MQRLAESYPTPREKEEVPVWIYLSRELSLKLHGAQGYHAFPRVFCTGGLIDGARMERLKQEFAIDTIVPVRTNMDLYQDAIGLTRLRDFTWEPYVAPVPPRPAETAIPKPPRVEKREARSQQTLAVAADPPQTLLGMGRGLLSWTQCPLPLTAAAPGLLLADASPTAHLWHSTPIRTCSWPTGEHHHQTALPVSPLFAASPTTAPVVQPPTLPQGLNRNAWTSWFHSASPA